MGSICVAFWGFKLQGAINDKGTLVCEDVDKWALAKKKKNVNLCFILNVKNSGDGAAPRYEAMLVYRNLFFTVVCRKKLYLKQAWHGHYNTTKRDVFQTLNGY